ncbi:MAG: serine hydrolase [Verrucomicrobiales bacterium]|nr:serine hydrolase [Verrucomicrobiales bacterium]
MKIHLSLLVSLLSLSAVCFGESSKTAFSRAVKKGVEKYAESGEFVGGVTLVGRDGEILDLQAHGVKDLKTREPVTTDSIFKIHSFTKAITCTAALMLYEEGKYQFDDPVFKWIPAFESDKPILVKHLFTHTSGLSYNYREPFKAGDLEAVVNALAAKPLSFEPGTSWEYGVSIDVLGRLIEIWSGQNYADFLRERLLDPLGMIDTAFHVPVEKETRRVKIHASEKGDPSDFSLDPENDSVPRERPEFCMPGGGLFSTATDYFRFLRMIENGGEWAGKRYIKPETHRLMITNQVPESVGWVRFGKQVRDGFGYGFGFNTVAKKSEWDPDARPGECGWGGKASCHYWFDPGSGITVITLEQIVPYRRSLEEALKGVIYEWDAEQ